MDTVRPIKVTVAALGGQGGGVVADWLIDVARREGYLAQGTSVPGVAQRTGATFYYLEFFPLSALPADGRKPVLALMPHPGDVDIVVASELMEAGRALQRGIVTPDRTTLIVSSHRIYAIGERTHMADGRADSERVAELARLSSRRYISFDMQATAEAHGSVISAVMLGALAGSKALPFASDSYREAIRASGIAVTRNLAAFEAGAVAAVNAESLQAGMRGARVAVSPAQAESTITAANNEGRQVGPLGAKAVSQTQAVGAVAVTGSNAADLQAPLAGMARREHGISSGSLATDMANSTARSASGDARKSAGSPAALQVPAMLAQQVEQTLPRASWATAREGVKRLVDYQDTAYAKLYLERLAKVVPHEREAAGAARLTDTLARTLALWMSFEDTIRVADLKIRGARKLRVLAEVRAKPGELVYVTEFMKPRAEEIFGTMPAAIGRRMSASPTLRRFMERFTEGRQISTSRVTGFLLLYGLAGLRGFRRGTLRYAEENAHITAWLDLVQDIAARDYELAIEVAECQTLVKGYGETHERGWRNFELIMSAVRRWVGEPGAAAKARELRTAAVADDQGIALAEAVKKVA
jgi:indolepyruvate ferredoxin oxidoreductase, beta subunit